MPDVVRSLGRDPEVVLGEIGIDPWLFDDPDNLRSAVKNIAHLRRH